MSTHILTLTPSDTLFFKDGRPMEGASSGHGAAWPLPNVLDSALHHALRRADLPDSHTHQVARSGKTISSEREKNGRQFGSLQTAGPFPIVNKQWYFPRPADADKASSATTTHFPLDKKLIKGTSSSLAPQLMPVVNTQPPTKDKSEKWMSLEAYTAYLNDSSFPEIEPDEDKKIHYLNDPQIFAAEHNIGIGINPCTGTQDGVSFYSASYLRLKNNAKIGLISQCMDKGKDSPIANNDLIAEAFPNSGAQTRILAGGQQRICSLTRTKKQKLPLPTGAKITERLVRWTLLTPTIFPALTKTHSHPGGWLPSWIDPETMRVQLKDPERSKRQDTEGRKTWRTRVNELSPIGAKLIAATIPRAIPVTGWANLDTNENTGNLDASGGARSTHLAVPAGAVYYFKAASKEEALQLANALNWHGTSDGTEIQNRRSSLMGEKGFGLGVCSNFTYH